LFACFACFHPNTKSADVLPGSVRRCCALVADIVAERFPEEEELGRRVAVGSVLFLRFFVPAVMSPVESGLLPASYTGLSPSVVSHLRYITAAIQVFETILFVVFKNTSKTSVLPIKLR
jgi:hypothetical protein